MDSSYSYKNYRTAIANLDSPCLFNLSLQLKDITFIEDGNPDFVDGNNNIINFSKRMLLYDSITKFLFFQKFDYPHKMDENICLYLSNIYYLEENELYELSLQREPKLADKNAVL